MAEHITKENHTLDDIPDGITYKKSHNNFTDELKTKLENLTTGTMEKIAEVNVSSNCTYVDFTGLDGNSAWFYVLFATIKNPTSNYCEYGIYVNGDTTNNHYYFQWVHGGGNSVSGNRGNPGIVATAESGHKVFSVIYITKDPDGYFMYEANMNKKPASSIELDYRVGAKTETISNITSLRIQSTHDNGIGAGSKFILFKVRRS